MQARSIIPLSLIALIVLGVPMRCTAGLANAGPRDVEGRFKKEKKRTAKLKFGDEIDEEKKLKKNIVGKDTKEATPIHKRRKQALEARKAFESLTVEELGQRKKVLLEQGENDVAIRYIERMMTLTQDKSMLQHLRFELAGIHFALENYEKAAKAYEEYTKSYPGSPECQEAAFKEIQSLYKQQLDPDRDQAMTVQTIEKAKHFLANGNYRTYRQHVEKLLHESYQLWYEAEKKIFHFYISRSRATCAQKRLDFIKKDLLPFLPLIKEELPELEEELKALKEGKNYVPSVKKTVSGANGNQKPKRTSFGQRF